MNDVFISYAHIDDQPMMEGQRGCIPGSWRSNCTELSEATHNVGTATRWTVSFED